MSVSPRDRMPHGLPPGMPTAGIETAPAAEVPQLSLDPDGRPLVLVDLAGEARDVTAWGVVTADIDGGTAVAVVCTDVDTQPDAPTFRRLADALDDDPNDPEPTRGSRAWEKARADRAVAELRRQADRLVELAGDLNAAGALIERLREAHDAQARTIRQQIEQIEALRADTKETRAVAARLAVIAVTRRMKPRRTRITDRPEERP